jgi:hypothetical protein
MHKQQFNVKLKLQLSRCSKAKKNYKKSRNNWQVAGSYFRPKVGHSNTQTVTVVACFILNV